MLTVLEVLMDSQKTNELSTDVEVPDKLLDSFGECCLEANLIDESGNFNDPFALVSFFCQPPTKKSNRKK